MIEILVLGELAAEGLASATGEMITAAKGLQGEVGVALLGDGLDDLAIDAIALGADKVFLAQDPLLAQPIAVDAHVAAFEQVCRQTGPKIVMMGRTELGRELGPRVAFRLGAGLAQDCVEVRLDSGTGRVVAVRPVYGGNALATVTFAGSGPQFVVLRGKVYDEPVPDTSRTGEVVPIELELDPSVVRIRHVETVRSESRGVRLEDASVVVTGGRGLGGPEGFEVLEELAGLLGGAVGASRPACDAGWVDHGYQVGLTGKTVTPELYIAVGVSGASQHMAGCSGAKNIVAINRDAEANMFREAAYGVTGDWQKVLPAFIEAVRDLVKS
jgi:electron transfer flavoprotein alpha subunit